MMSVNRIREKLQSKIYFCATFLIFLSLIPKTCVAANHYVRASATGTRDGSDWTNAFTVLPATLVRGDTYYVATGSYPDYACNTPVSGALVITIKKASVADHGTSTGWSDAFGTGQAVFSNQLSFSSSNWIFDGQYRTSRKSGHGFKIDNSASPSAQAVLLIGAISNITVRYTEVQGAGLDNPIITREYYSIGRSSNVTISYGYIHDSSNTPILTADANGWTFEYSTIARNSSSATAHAEAWADQGTSNVIIRNNVFEDIMGSGVIVVLQRSGFANADNWDIYGNVFLTSSGNPYNRGGLGDGAIAVINGQEASNWNIYDNTFINLNWTGGGQTTASRIYFLDSPGTNRNVYNNLWYNCTNANHNGSLTDDYNYYINTTGTPAEPHGQTTPATDPFVAWSSGDFHLSRSTNPGLTLSATFNTDPDGIIRGVNGVWDRGAYQFTGAATRPIPPQNLRITAIH